MDPDDDDIDESEREWMEAFIENDFEDPDDWEGDDDGRWDDE